MKNTAHEVRVHFNAAFLTWRKKQKGISTHTGLCHMLEQHVSSPFAESFDQAIEVQEESSKSYRCKSRLGSAHRSERLGQRRHITDLCPNLGKTTEEAHMSMKFGRNSI